MASRSSGPIERRQPVGEPVDRAEVQDDEPAVVEQPEVARVRVGVQQPGPRRAGEQEPGEQQAGPVALLRRARGDDPGQRRAVDPLAHEHLVGDVDHRRHEDVGVAGVRRREGGLAARLELVVELLGHPRLQLGHQRLHVEPGHEQPDQPAHPPDLGEVGHQRLRRRRGTAPSRRPRARRHHTARCTCPIEAAAAGPVVELAEARRASRLRARGPARRAPCGPAAAGRPPAAWSASRGRARPGSRAGPPRTPTSPGRTSWPRP